MAKIKVKTHRGAAKRFKVTAGGKVMRTRSGRRYLLGTKPAKRMRKLRKSIVVHPSDARNVREMLPYG